MVSAVGNKAKQFERFTLGGTKLAKTLLLGILLFGFAWQVVELLLLVVALLQLGFLLFAGAPDSRLAGFGGSLAEYARQIGRYVSQTSEQKPWPFIEWPAASVRPSQAAAPGQPATAPPTSEPPAQP